MATENNVPETSAIVEITPQTDALVEQELAHESADVRQETKALIDAIRMRAQTELQTAGDFTRDSYLKAVRQAREAVEQNQLIDPERIEQSVQLIQAEAEKNWNTVLSEMEALGNRLADAAKAAWDRLMDK
ncbi:MAG: hypothetical protein HC881_10175 [Leptolyngbyaceae cyanobacterium SL_7_1]|nr:hypothetical protein [Leptolyngbyaceae cyanobacterium SL_7_1]